MTVEGQVVRALGSISAATLASRVLGFVRDMVVALVFGAGPVTDAFFVAFRIPNMLRRLLAEGALSTALVPVFTDYVATRQRDEVVRMLRSVVAASLLALAVTTLIGIAAAPFILKVIAPGFAADPEQMRVAVMLTRVMFPYLFLVGLAALGMAALHAHGRFFAAALGPAVLNLAMIAAVLGLASRLDPPVLSLAIGVLAGGVGQWLIQLPSLRRIGAVVTPSAELRHPALARVGRLLVPAIFGLAAVQVTVFVNTLLASLLPAGSISFLYYADRVMEFPLGVFGIALASASLPTMSRQAAVGDHRGLADTVNFTLRLALYVAVPATVGLIMLRTPITRVLFERGRFGPEDTIATAQALAWYAVGLVGFSTARIVAQAFYALGDPGTAVKVGLLSVGANVIAALALMEPLAHGGLALASSVAGYVNVGLLLWVTRRRLGRLGGRAIAASLARTVAACAPLVGWCALCLWMWPLSDDRWLEAAWLALAIGGSAAVFWGASRLLAAPEAAALRAVLPVRGAR